MTTDSLDRVAKAAFLAGKARGIPARFWDNPDCDRNHWRKIARAVLATADITLEEDPPC